MKTLKKLLVVFLLVCVGYFLIKTNFLSTAIAMVKNAPKNVVTSVQDKIDDAKLQEYEKRDAEQKAENERLKQIITVNSIDSAIKKETKLQLLQRDKTYQVPVDKRGFISWFDNTLHAEIPYTYYIVIDTTNIRTVSAEDKTVHFEVDVRYNLDIIVELHSDQMKLAKDKDYLAVKFYEKDIQNLLAQSQADIIGKVKDDTEVYNIALQQIKDYLNNEAAIYGYTADIIFNE